MKVLVPSVPTAKREILKSVSDGPLKSQLNCVLVFNTDPGQAFTSVSVDQNFWFFYQSPDNNFFNLITDANVSFLVTTNLIQIKASDFNQTIQPYVVPATLGISVIFTTLDPLTNDIVPSVVLKFSRTISGVGNVDSGSGITDTLGRLSLPFVPTIDHNFTVEFPGGTVLQTGTYNPQTVDATNGIKVLVPLDQITGDTNSEGVVDINFLQSQVIPPTSNLVDLNQIVSTTRTISAITINVDHNGVNLFNDVNTGSVASGGIS